MAGPPGLVRVVAGHGTVLLAVQHLDRGVAIRNPRRGGGLCNAVPELVLHPLGRARKLVLLCRAGRMLWCFIRSLSRTRLSRRGGGRVRHNGVGLGSDESMVAFHELFL